MRAFIPLLFATALCGTLPDCARRRPPEVAAPDPSAAEVPVTVENHFWNDVVVYFLRDGVRERLGLVPAVTTKEFVLPYRKFAAGATVRLQAHPIGGNQVVTTEVLLVQLGQEIEWTIESTLERSSVGIY